MKVIQSCLTLWDPMDCRPWNSPGQNTEVGSLSLLQGIFPTQGLNPDLSHCRWILYQLSHKGSPRILGWVAYPFSSRSSWPRNRTRASCIAGRFFTNWAIAEVKVSEASLNYSFLLHGAAKPSYDLTSIISKIDTNPAALTSLNIQHAYLGISCRSCIWCPEFYFHNQAVNSPLSSQNYLVLVQTCETSSQIISGPSHYILNKTWSLSIAYKPPSWASPFYNFKTFLYNFKTFLYNFVPFSTQLTRYQPHGFPCTLSSSKVFASQDLSTGDSLCPETLFPQIPWCAFNLYFHISA